MATYYWVGGSGSWSDAKWATTSGGTGNGSINFKTAPSFVTIPTAWALPTTTTPFTIELWVYPTMSPNGTAIFGHTWSGGQSQTFALQTGGMGGISGSNLSFGYYASSAWTGINSSTPLPTGQWSHIAASYDGTTASLYLNGTRIGTYTGAWTNSVPQSGFNIGKRWDGFGTGFTGRISNFRYVQGTAIYSGATITVPTSALTAVAGTQALLKSSTYSTAYTDSSSNNYTITPSGTYDWNTASPFVSAITITSADDVTFDSLSYNNSYTITITSGAVCKSVYFYKPSSGTLSIADTGNQLSVYGALITDSTNVTSTQTGGFSFRNQSTQIWYNINLNGNTGFSTTPVQINTNPTGGAGMILGADSTLGNVTIDDGTLDLRGSTLTCNNFTVNSGAAATPVIVTYTQGVDWSAGGLVFKPNIGIAINSGNFTNFDALNAIASQPTSSVLSVSGGGDSSASISPTYTYAPYPTFYQFSTHSLQLWYASSSDAQYIAAAAATSGSIVTFYVNGVKYYGTVSTKGTSTSTAYGPTAYIVQLSFSNPYYTLPSNDVSSSTATVILRTSLSNGLPLTQDVVTTGTISYNGYPYLPFPYTLLGWSSLMDTNITSITFSYTPGVYGGLTTSYGSIRASGNFVVGTQIGNRVVAFNDTGVPAWGPTTYTSQLASVTIGVLNAQQYRYYIEVAFNNGTDAYNFSQQVMTQGSGTPYSVTMSGRCQNTVGSSFFTANNASTWLDFNIPKGIFNSWQQQGGNPWAYRNEFNWIGSNSTGATFTNSAGSGATMVASGGGADELRLTGATSKFSGGFLSTGMPVSYPFVTFKSTAPIANTYYSNQGKEIGDGSSIKNLYIEGPAATGHTLVCVTGTVTITKSLTVNANTTGPLSRVLIWYDQAGQNTTYIPSSTEAKFAFPDDNSGTAVLKDTDLRNIKFTGGYVTMMSNLRVGDMGGCTNIGADSPKTWYWTNGTFGGSLLWTTTNWASTSAGTVVTDGFPLPQDTIKITDDLLTSGGTLTIPPTDGILPTLDFSLRSLPVTLSTSSNNMYVSGNINIPNGPTTITATGGYIYLIGGTAQTITGASRSWNKSFVVSAPFASVSFASNFTSSVSYSSASTPSLAVARGTLDISDKTITVKEFSSTYPYSSASRTLVTTANTQINLSGTGGVWSASGAGWTVTGPNPKLYLTDSTSGSKSISNYYSFSSSDPANGWTFKPVDVYALAGSGPVTVNGVFGTVDMCSGTCTGTLTLSVYSIVTDYLRVLDNSNLNAQFNLAPANGNTCQFITNWVYGQGAVGTNGSSTNLLTIGFDANRQYGTVILTGNLNVTAYAGYGIYHTPSTFDISNYTVRLNAYSVYNSPSYNTALIMNNSTITLLDPTSPASFSTTRFTPTYNSNSLINITGYTGPNLPTISASSGIVIPPIAIKNGYGVTLSIANSTIASLSATGGQTINIQAGTTANFKALSINGTRNNPVVIKSTSSGTRSYIGKTGGAVIATGLSLTDITASGNAEFTAYESPSATRSSGWTVNTTKRPPSGFLSFC